MTLVVDTCVLLDVALADTTHGISSAAILERYLNKGLTICPVTFIELAPQFGGNLSELREFLSICGVDPNADWLNTDTLRCAQIFTDYVHLKRKNMSTKRPIADTMIGSFASRFAGLITRNQKDFQPYFPKLKLILK